jgi:rhodanese-related sulfurtransferase
MRRVIIVGSSLAAAKVATRLKRKDPSSEVNIIVPAVESGQESVKDGVFYKARAERHAVAELLRSREVGVVEASDLSVDFDARVVLPTSSRGSLPIRYNVLVLEVQAQPRIPRVLRGAPNVIGWPGEGAATLDAMLSTTAEVRVVVVGQGQAAMEALRLVARSGQVPVWLRLGDVGPDILDGDTWRMVERLAANGGVEVHDWSHVPMERMGARPDEHGGVAALVAVLEGGNDLRVEGDVFIWTAPTVVQHPVVAQEGITLDAHGRIEVDGNLATVEEGVYLIGTGVAMACGCGSAPLHVGEHDLAGLARGLADHLAGDATTTMPPCTGLVHAEGPGFAVSRAGVTLEEAVRRGLEGEFALLPLEDGGLLKLVADKVSRQVIGYQATGTGESLDLLAPLLSFAVGRSATVDELAASDCPGPVGTVVRKVAGILANKMEGRFYGITADELRASREAGAEFFLLDLRAMPEWRNGHIPGAYNIPLPQLAKRLQDEVPRFTPIVLVSRTSDAAWSVACKLFGLGATALYVLDGGMRCWDYELETA